MSEGMMPVRVRKDAPVFDGIEMMLQCENLLASSNDVVVCSLDRASWDAMVERAARARARTMWNHQTDDVRHWWKVRMALDLRAALALPPDWEPSDAD